MWEDSDSIIVETDKELRKPETSKDRVQELFHEWWERRIGWAVLEGQYENERWSFPVKVIKRVGTVNAPVPYFGFLHFPKDKLWGQTDRILRGRSARPVDDCILQAAGRIASLAFHISCENKLEDNLAYMMLNILDGDRYTMEGIAGLAGGLRDFRCNVPLAARVTYALGKTAKAYCGKLFDDLGEEGGWDRLADIYRLAKAEAKGIDWSDYKDEEDVSYYKRTQSAEKGLSEDEAETDDCIIPEIDFGLKQRDYNSDGQYAEKLLTDAKTSAKKVQTIFDKLWQNRTSLVLKEDGFYMFYAWYMPQDVCGISSGILPPHALLHFQESKLKKDQIALLEQGMCPWLEDHNNI